MNERTNQGVERALVSVSFNLKQTHTKVTGQLCNGWLLFGNLHLQTYPLNRPEYLKKKANPDR